ncbi:hypothetical protein MGYG_09142 [Nannizzia gypsea CBS 118893]|uniref:Uncharacterized protein n=1 Tax=Arthroderma gypseum (strain ATCC MYA-4604 / CBS 118893) TaxID=535722 RepID=E4V1G5_ARTGP|nr:hypothetical protein MGYG_09142 [Nannizzia gypsea CBS 118893]EFR03880.1 hypothetical protein MGYG_09142 [Nannizzia gypsea CBS 118893]
MVPKYGLNKGGDHDAFWFIDFYAKSFCRAAGRDTVHEHPSTLSGTAKEERRTALSKWAGWSRVHFPSSYLTSEPIMEGDKIDERVSQKTNQKDEDEESRLTMEVEVDYLPKQDKGASRGAYVRLI